MTVAVPLEHPVKDRLLTPAQRAFWEENGYVIIPDAVPQGNLEAVIDAIWAFLKVDRDDPETWYEAPVSRAGMLEMFHHQSLWDNRQHPRDLPGIRRCVAAGRAVGQHGPRQHEPAGAHARLGL